MDTVLTKTILTKYAGLLAVRVHQLEQEGIIQKAIIITEGVYAVTPGREGWGALARDLVVGLGGMTRVIGRGGVSWQMGKNIVGYLLDPSTIPEICTAQALLEPLCPAVRQVWTMGKIARLALRYVGPGGRKNDACEVLLHGIDYGYMEVHPGHYENARYFDVSGYYYNIMARMPFLRPCIAGDRLQWPTPHKGERERWQEVLSLVVQSKSLRNAMAGVAAGSLKWGGFYKENKDTGQGQWQPVKPMPGEYRTAGLLIVRTAWEVTRAEVDTPGTIYSRTDSLITTGEGSGAWKAAGFSVKEIPEFSGRAHIVCLGAYDANGHKTMPYQDREEQLKAAKIWPGQVLEPKRVERRALPENNYSSWLYA